MAFFSKLTDFLTQGSDRPMRRLLAYYIGLALATTALAYAFPVVDRMFSGEQLEPAGRHPAAAAGRAHQPAGGVTHSGVTPRVELAISTALICFGTLALMLPVSWVYMSTKRTPRHNQSVVQALIILPIIVAGIILIVRNSLALAFSLAGVVSVLRFRTTLTDVRDIMFIFLGIAVGFAAGVQVLMVAVILSVVFNFVLLLTWRYDFGRSVLEPTAAIAVGRAAEQAGAAAERRVGAGPGPRAGAHAEEGRTADRALQAGAASRSGPMPRSPATTRSSRSRPTSSARPRPSSSWRSTRSPGAGSWTRS